MTSDALATTSWQGRVSVRNRSVLFQCPLCGDFCKNHAHLFTHTADAHPSRLDNMPVGRLGNIMIYQSTAKLFHCFECFFTTTSFPSLYDHIVSKHCVDRQKDAGGEDGDKLVDWEEVEEAGEAEKAVKEESLKRKRSSEGDDDEEEERGEDEGGDGGVRKEADENAGAEVSACMSEEGIPYLAGKYYRCQGCSFANKLRAAAVNHAVKKHRMARSYASARVPFKRRRASEEEEAIVPASQRNSDFLREEMEATAKLFKVVSKCYICATCGWKTKAKGTILLHNSQSHQMERAYSCKECRLSFFLPSLFQQHMYAAHRAGRYSCPFCPFRSPSLGGFKVHCKRCNVPEEERGDGGGGGQGENGEEERAEAEGEEEKGEGAGEGEMEQGINKEEGGGGGEGGVEGKNGEERHGDGSDGQEVEEEERGHS